MEISWPWLSLMTWKWGGIWFRVPRNGPGLWFTTYKALPETFSERNGCDRVFRLGNWARWKLLAPYRPPSRTPQKLLTDGNVQHEGVRYRIFKGSMEWNPTRHGSPRCGYDWWPLGWQQVVWSERHREMVLPFFHARTTEAPVHPY